MSKRREEDIKKREEDIKKREEDIKIQTRQMSLERHAENIKLNEEINKLKRVIKSLKIENTKLKANAEGIHEIEASIAKLNETHKTEISLQKEQIDTCEKELTETTQELTETTQELTETTKKLNNCKEQLGIYEEMFKQYSNSFTEWAGNIEKYIQNNIGTMKMPLDLKLSDDVPENKDINTSLNKMFSKLQKYKIDNEKYINELILTNTKLLESKNKVEELNIKLSNSNKEFKQITNNVGEVYGMNRHTILFKIDFFKSMDEEYVFKWRITLFDKEDLKNCKHLPDQNGFVITNYGSIDKITEILTKNQKPKYRINELINYLNGQQ